MIYLNNFALQNLYHSSLPDLFFLVSSAIAARGLGAASQYDDIVRRIFKRQTPPASAVTIDLKYFSSPPTYETLNRFVQCYDDAYFCARLKVPLDPFEPERGTGQNVGEEAQEIQRGIVSAS